MKFNLKALALILLTTISTPTKASEIKGKAYVIDGDTIDINNNRIRIYGIDALERGQTCNSIFNGEISKLYLTGLLRNEIVSCETSGIDKYKRNIAVCSVKNEDIAEIMLTRGLVFAYQYRKKPTYKYDYLDQNYGRLEKIAAKKGLGLHSIDCQRPHFYRKKKNG